jgi:Thioredoxin like C-terminal domain
VTGGVHMPALTGASAWINSGSASHGVDVDEQGAAVLGDGRLNQLVRQHDGVRERTVEITLEAGGAQAYVFTFG